jgi:hypothetical protein
MIKTISKTKLAGIIHPWSLFFVFLISNILISYFSISFTGKIGVWIFGILLPFCLSLFQKLTQEKISFHSGEFISPVPFWIIVIFAAAALFVRFWKLTTLSVWPHYDEGLWGFFALKVFQGWGWHLFYAGNPYPSAYIWILGIWFHWFTPSLFTFWLLPVLFSILIIGMGYLAARQFFSKSLSFLFAFLLAFNFWLLYMARFSSQQEPMLLWECLLFFLIGKYFQAETTSERQILVLLLGLISGTGFYFYISWAAVALIAGLTVAMREYKKKSFFFPEFCIFIFSTAVMVLPLLFNGLVQGYEHYFQTIGAFSSSLSPEEQLKMSFSYLGALFWGLSGEYHTFQPIWGGFLNPVLDALFLLGFLEILRYRSVPLYQWLLSSFFLLIIPAMLTQSCQPFRMVPVIPILFAFCILGWQRLSIPSQPLRTNFLVFALAFSIAGLDFYHIAVPYHQLWNLSSNWRGYAKSIVRCRAYFILKNLSQKEGPGLIYSNFTPGLCDQSLSVLDNSFNAAENPEISFQSAKWAAVLTNVNYKPFLSKRFPNGTAYFIDNLPSPDGGYMLWIIPVDHYSKKTMAAWQNANNGFCCMPGRADTDILKDLQQAYPLFQTDPFLRACYWEKISDLLLRIGHFQNFASPEATLEKACKDGYPSAHLYYRLGTLYKIERDEIKSKKAFLKATHAPINLTNANQFL